MPAAPQPHPETVACLARHLLARSPIEHPLRVPRLSNLPARISRKPSKRGSSVDFARSRHNTQHRRAEGCSCGTGVQRELHCAHERAAGSWALIDAACPPPAGSNRSSIALASPTRQDGAAARWACRPWLQAEARGRRFSPPGAGCAVQSCVTATLPLSQNAKILFLGLDNAGVSTAHDHMSALEVCRMIAHSSLGQTHFVPSPRIAENHAAAHAEG